MSNEFKLPEDWDPTFEKDYAIHGNRFTVQVESLGIVNVCKGVTIPKCVWNYALVVNGTRIYGGQFYWDPSARKLTSETVANQVGSFWGPSEFVKQCQRLWKMPENLDKIVEKCA